MWWMFTDKINKNIKKHYYKINGSVNKHRECYQFSLSQSLQYYNINNEALTFSKKMFLYWYSNIYLISTRIIFVGNY